MNRFFVLVLVGMRAGLSAQSGTSGGQAVPFPRPAPPNQAQQTAATPHETPNPMRIVPMLRQRSVSMKLKSRILSENDNELWINEAGKTTTPGHPITIKLMGNNVAMLVQFTPYLRSGEQWVLVAQGQIWLRREANRIHYETTLQTIPIKLDEPVYYFPLGSKNSGGGDYIEICVEISPLVIETDKGEARKKEENSKEKNNEN